VRAAAARALGKTRRQDALDHLLAARDQSHPRVRRAIAAALGEYRGDARAGLALAAWLRAGDPSLFVEAEAAAALGKTRAPAALELLPEVMLRPSYQDLIRTRAIEGLGATGDERAILLLRAEWRASGPFPPRRAVVAALGEVAQGTLAARGVREFLEDRFSDPDFRVRMAVAEALGRLGDRAAVPAIERALAAELDGRARRRMREAITDLREGARPAERLTRLQEEVERLRAETARMRERLDAVEARQGARPPASPPSGPAPGGERGETRPPKRPRPTARRGGRPGRPAPIRRRR